MTPAGPKISSRATRMSLRPSTRVDFMKAPLASGPLPYREPPVTISAPSERPVST